jgi:hypothetical protein
VHSSPIGGVRATPLFAPRTPGTLTAMDATCSSSTVATWRGAMAGLAVRQVSEPRARPWRTPALNARTASVYARHMYDQYNTSIRIPGLSDCLETGAKLQTHCRSANNPSTCAQARDSHGAQPRARPLRAVPTLPPAAKMAMEPPQEPTAGPPPDDPENDKPSEMDEAAADWCAPRLASLAPRRAVGTGRPQR